MSKVFDKIFTAVFLMALTLSCASNEKEPAPEISAEQTQITFSGEKASRSIEVTASGSWTAETDAAWCRAVKTGGAVFVSVEKNGEGALRSATVTLRCSTASATITVLQNAAESAVSFAQHEIIVDATVLETSVKLSADTKWRISLPQADDWISAAPTEGDGDATILITMTRNEAAQLRQSTLTLSYTDNASGQDKQTSLTVKQKAIRAQLSVSESAIKISHEQSQFSVTLSAMGFWTAKVSEGGQWLDISPAEGASGEHTITLNAQANTTHELRNAVVRFSGQENKLATLRITQDSMPHDRDTVRVMTYNQHYGFGMDKRIDYARFAKVIDEYHPDFVAVQELDSMATRSAKVYQLGRLASLTGMVGTYCPTIDFQGGKYGIGILSRKEPLSVTSISLPVSGEARRMVVAEFEDIVFCCTHFPLNETERLNSANKITKFIQSMGTDKPVIVGGDFNAYPDENAVTRLKRDFEMLNDETEHTFPADNPDRTIDYLYMYKNAAAGKKIGCGVVAESVASDHRPVWADVVFLKK